MNRFFYNGEPLAQSVSLIEWENPRANVPRFIESKHRSRDVTQQRNRQRTHGLLNTRSARHLSWAHRKGFLGTFLLLIFAFQFWFAINAAIPTKPMPLEPIPASAPTEFAFLNHTQIMENADGNFAVWANGSVYLIAEIGGLDVPWGGDQASFQFSEANCEEWEQKEYTCHTGLQSFPTILDDELKLYNLSIPDWCRDRFTSLSVQPIFIAQGDINATRDYPQQIFFNASGDIAILIWSMCNFTDLGLYIDGNILKRNDYTQVMDYPCTLVAGVVFESEWLCFPASVSAGEHVLEVFGGSIPGEENDTIFYSIVHGTADFDSDLLLDYEEIILQDPNLTPRWANMWGYQTIDENYQTIPIEEMIEEQDVEGVWVHESLVFYVPEALDDVNQELSIVASNGQFTNISLDGDETLFKDVTLNGYCGSGYDTVTLINPDVGSKEYYAEDIIAPDWIYGGFIRSGWHAVSYEVFRSTLESPELDLYLDLNYIPILDTKTNYQLDSDDDGIPDDFDVSPDASLIWRRDSLMQLSVPCDLRTEEDVQIKIQVTRDADDPDVSKLLEWHAAEDTGRDVRLSQVMIIYGPGDVAPSRGDVDYWDNLNELCLFLDALHPWEVDTYNLIGKDAYGFSNESALTGDCDPLPFAGTDAFEYQKIVFPLSAEYVSEYTVEYPSDHPAILNDGVINLRFRFAIAVIDQSKVDPEDFSLLGLYDYPRDLTISGVEATFLSDINGLLGEPRDTVSHLACWLYNMNPAISMDWDSEIEHAIVADFTGAHYMRQYNWNEFDNTTLGAAERLNYARNVTPWDTRSAEVTYVTQTTREIDILSKINQSVWFDLTTGEQYSRYPNMYDFSLIAPGRYLFPDTGLVPGWTCTTGSGQASILRNVQSRADVLQLTTSTGITIRGDRGVASNNGLLSFGFYLIQPAKILEVRLGNAGVPDAIELVFADEFLYYRDADGVLHIINEIWTGEWFTCKVFFDTETAMFDVFVDGPTAFAATDLPFATICSEVQTVDFVLSEGCVGFDSMGLYWEDEDPSENEPEKSFDAIHYGDKSYRTTFYTVSDVYNGTYSPGDPELASDEMTLYTTYYSSLQHAMQRVKINNWPMMLQFIRANNSLFDGFKVDNFLNVTFAQGTFYPSAWIPNTDTSPYTWNIRDAPDTALFRNLLVNEWVDCGLDEVPATICFTAGDIARWEWDWRIGEIDPWLEFHTHHSPEGDAEPVGKIGIDGNLGKILGLLKKIKDFAKKTLDRINNNEIPDFEVETYHAALGGNVLDDPSSLEQNNVGAWGAYAGSTDPSEKMFFVKETFNREDLKRACEELLVAFYNLLNIICSDGKHPVNLYRFVTLKVNLLRQLRPDLWQTYNIGAGGRLPPEIVEQLPVSFFDVKDASFSPKFRDARGNNYYVKRVSVPVTPEDQLEALRVAAAACEIIHPRYSKWHPLLVAYMNKFLGLDPRKVALGEPGEEINIMGQKVILPKLTPDEQALPRVYKDLNDFLPIPFKKVKGYPVTTINGREVKFDLHIVYYNRGPLHSDQWIVASPFTFFDPQNSAAALGYASELGGAKIFYILNDKILRNLDLAGRRTTNQYLKQEYLQIADEVRQLLLLLGYGDIDNTKYQSIRKTQFDPASADFKKNVLSDLYYEFEKQPFPLGMFCPQCKPEKIKFEIYAMLFWEKKDLENTFELKQSILPIDYPTPYIHIPLSPNEESGPGRHPMFSKWAEFFAKLEEPYNLHGTTLNYLEKTGIDWETAFQEADLILERFLLLIMRSDLLLKLRDDPDYLLKLIAIAKNVIKLLEETLPEGRVRSFWVRRIMLIISSEPYKYNAATNLDVPFMMRALLKELTGVGAEDLNKMLTASMIRPTQFTKERFLEFTWEEESIPQDTTNKGIGGLLGSHELPPGLSGYSNPDEEKVKKLWLNYINWIIDEIIANETLPTLNPPTAPAWGLLGSREYIERVGASIMFDIFFAYTLPEISQSLSFVTASEGFTQAYSTGLTTITAAAPTGMPTGWVNPLYQQLYGQMMQQYNALPSVQQAQSYAHSLTQYGGSGGAYGEGPLQVWVSGGGGGDPWGFNPALGDGLQQVFDELHHSPELLNMDPDRLVPDPVMTRLAQVVAILSIVTYAFSAFNLIRDYQRGASVVQLGFDWASLAIAAVQMGVSIAMITFTTTSVAVGALTSAFLTTISTGAFYAAIIEAVMLLFVWLWSVNEQSLAEIYNTLDIDVSAKLVLPASSKASLIRNGSLHPNDRIGLQYTVQNQGVMTWSYWNIQSPASTGSPFWLQSSLRAGAPDALGEWSPWAGPWTGGPMYPYDWLAEDLAAKAGDCVWPEMHWSTNGGEPWDHTVTARTKTYTNYAYIPHATTKLACQVQTQIATAYNGRTNAPNPDAGDVVIIGDMNRDGRIDPLYEEALPVLEDTMGEFLAACTDVTPAVTLDDIIANFSSAVEDYRWLDAVNYLTTYLDYAETAAVLPETQFNALLPRFENLTGDHANQVWRDLYEEYVNLRYLEEPLPEVVVDNYYLLQTSSITEWMSLLGGEQGEALLNAGWRAARPNYDIMYDQDFSTINLDVTDFPTDWERNPSTGGGTNAESLVKVQWRDPDAYDELVLRIKDTGDIGWSMSATKDFGPIIQGRLFVSLEMLSASWGHPIYFGLANPTPSGSGSSSKPWTDVIMFSVQEAAYGGEYYVYLGDPTIDPYQTDPLFTSIIYPGFEYVFFIDFDVIAGTATFHFGLGDSITVLLQSSLIPTQFRTYTQLWKGNGQEYLIHSIALQCLDDQSAHLNSFGHTAPQGQILVPKSWVKEVSKAFNYSGQFSPLINQLPCMTNIMASFVTENGESVLNAGSYLRGTIDFVYCGTDNPIVSYEIKPPAGWVIGYDSKRVPLKNLVQLPLTIEVPIGTPAGTYYFDFIEKRDDGSSFAGNITYACRIPIRVRYNASWALDMAGIPDVLWPGSSDEWATFQNNGTAPVNLFITGDGVPLDWLAADGYASVARWDFNGGTGGWVHVGIGDPTFLDNDNFAYVHSEIVAANRPVDYYPFWQLERAYFTVPSVPEGDASPCALIMQAWISEAEGTPGSMFAIAPAQGLEFDPAARVWQAELATLPLNQHIWITNLQPGGTYVAFIDGTGYVQAGSGAYYPPTWPTPHSGYPWVQYLYDKVTTTSQCLLLQSDTNEIVVAMKNVSALIQPGDRIRIIYENFGSAGAMLGAWDSFSLTGSGWQGRTFVADGFYALANLTLSALVGPGATFRVDSISLERSLSRNAPRTELTFAGESATPEMYGWAAEFDSGTATMAIEVPVTNAVFVDRDCPQNNYNTGTYGTELYVGNTPGLPPNEWAALLEIPALQTSYSTFGSANHPLLVARYSAAMPIKAYPCDAFYETNATWANSPYVWQDQGITGASIEMGSNFFYGWDVTNFPTNYVCLNATKDGWWIFPSDEGPADIRPRVIYSFSKWGVTDGTLLVQSDRGEGFHMSRALTDVGQNLTVQAGDKVWVSFETTSSGGATLVLANADPLGADLSFPLTTAADQNRGTIYREFVIPVGGNYTTLAIDGILEAGKNFSLSYAGVYHYQPYGTPFTNVSIGGVYNETISSTEFTQYAPFASGSFTFDGTSDGFTGEDVSTANGNLILMPVVASAVAATCALAGIITLENTRARARFNSTVAGGITIAFSTKDHNTYIWDLPTDSSGSWCEVTFTLPSLKNITGIIITGTFAEHETFALDYLILEVQIATPCVFPEVAGRRDVVALKNIVACGGAVDYAFPEPQTRGRLDLSIYAPGTNGTLVITLAGTDGAGINLTIADWQLWLGNLSGAVAAAGIYGGWHSLSIAWDCAIHNYTVWYFKQTLIEANYTTGWGILNFTGTAITGVRIGSADVRSAYYLDGVYFDPIPMGPTNQSLVDMFRPGSGIYVDLRPGEEWTLQLAAPPRAPSTAPGTYSVHLAIYDASNGQLIGLVHKDITIPPFYDIELSCYAPSQVILDDGWVQGDFTFTGILANRGNVEQTFTLSAPGIASGVTSAHLVDTGGTWEPAGPITLAPGASVAYKLEIQDAPRIACTFAIEAASANNVTSIPVSFVFSGWPSYESTIDPIEIEWQPAGVDLMFVAWDNTTLDPWFEASMGPISLGNGTWESGVPFGVSLDPLLAMGDYWIGREIMVFVALHDGYYPDYWVANPMHVIVIINNVLPTTIAPADMVTIWETSLEPLSWTLIDNNVWDPATSWQDDFGDGALGPQWIPADVTEYNGTLRLPPPAPDWMGTQLLAPAPADEDYAIVARLAHVPITGTGAGIVIPTDDDGNFIKWQADPLNSEHTSWNLWEYRFRIGTSTYGPISGVVTTLAVVVHGAGPMATYDLWYCLNDTSWIRAVEGQSAVSVGAPARRTFGLCTSAADISAEFDWVRCQTLRAAPGATYTLDMDGTVVASGGWAGFDMITLSLDDLRPLGPAFIGTHDFTLVLNDPVGGITSSTVVVDITQVSPVLSQPLDYSGVEGDTPTITWNVFDNYAVTPSYIIYLGPLGSAGTPIASGTWVSGGTITVALPASTSGIFTCRVVATNDLGGVSEDQVILTIVQAALVPAPDVTSADLPVSVDQVVVWETPTLTLDVTLTTTAEVTLVAGAWTGNPVIGVPPELATEGAYFSLAASDETAIQFPLTLTVTFPYNPTYGWSEADLARWVGAYVYNEASGVWELADCTVLGVRRYGTPEGSFVDVTLSVPHLSIFAVGLLNLPPGLSAPADIAYLGGSTGYAIAWQVTDDTIFNPTYTITRDGYGITSGVWASGDLITINVDGFAPGAYNFTLMADDGRFGTASDSVMVVVDNFAPAVSAPQDIIYTWGTTGNAITWYLTDDAIQNPSYSLTRDGTFVGGGAWPLSNIITLNVDGLAVGTYWYHLEISDGLTGTASDDVRISVLNTLPVLSAPLDASYEYGSAGASIAWAVADETVLAGTYAITLGGFPVASGAWVSGDLISWTPIDLLPGTWAATLTVNDGYGGVTSDSLAITVTNAPPAITGPHSAVFEAGNASAGAWVTITDMSTASDAAYSIYRNGTRVSSGRWASGDSIYVNLRFTPPGRHNIEIVAWDGLGGVATHSLLATTTNMAPVVIAPAFVTFEAGTTAPVLNWTITDESAENATYALAVNGMTFANSTWVSGDIVSLAVGDWAPGTYNVTLSAADGWGTMTENGTLITVTNPAPVVIAPPPITYEEGDTRPVASFIVTDIATLDPTYSAYLDGFLVATGTWTPGVSIELPVSGLAPGTHAITLLVADGYGATAEGNTPIIVYADDDTTCIIGDLTCVAFPTTVTVAFALVDPSGYSAVNYFHVDGVTPTSMNVTVNGTHAIVTFPNVYGLGLHVVNFSLTDGDNDRPGDGAVGVFTCSFRNGPDVQTLLDAVDIGIGMVWASPDADWRKPAANRKAEMVSKFGELRALLEAGNYSAAYDVLLHDLKPKLTSLKTDEHEMPWGNGEFKNPWVTDAALQEQFLLWANDLLQGIEDILISGEDISDHDEYDASSAANRGETSFTYIVLGMLLALLGVACGMIRDRRYFNHFCTIFS